MKKAVVVFFRILLGLLLAGMVFLLAARLVTARYARPRLYALQEVPARRAAIVFGAGLRRDGTPTAVLRDRVEMAVRLYFAGKVERLLFSGDNRFVDYNEPAAMRQYALALGVPPEVIVLDYAGRRTYDTCYRARHIFRLEQAILVTQSFHLPRALYTCNRLGLEAIGVAADFRTYHFSSMLYWKMREALATAGAFWDLYVSHPLPVLGEEEPIFP
ncbi:MAG: ElyC/SanA/YdcF family protein [Anaerolineales bacterium]